jgi:hypothetical protein
VSGTPEDAITRYTTVQDSLVQVRRITRNIVKRVTMDKSVTGSKLTKRNRAGVDHEGELVKNHTTPVVPKTRRPISAVTEAGTHLLHVREIPRDTTISKRKTRLDGKCGMASLVATLGEKQITMGRGWNRIPFREEIASSGTINPKSLRDEAIIFLWRRVRVKQEVTGSGNQTSIFLGRRIRVGQEVTRRTEPANSLKEWVIIKTCRLMISNEMRSVMAKGWTR